MIVLHYTAGITTESAVQWFMMPESKVSAHYIIGRTGDVVQMVLNTDIAWHAGVWDINMKSIGIELVGIRLLEIRREQLNSLLRGKSIELPQYCFVTHQRIGQAPLPPADILIYEGTMLLHDLDLVLQLGLKIFLRRF
jgi:N-acetylmuramoyl-L-alanine amidase